MGAKIRLQTDYVNKEGKCRFYLVIYDPSTQKRKHFALDVYLDQKFWDDKQSKIKGTHPYAVQYRSQLNQIIDKAELLILQLKSQSRFSFKNFEDAFFNTKNGSLSELFLEYIEKHGTLGKGTIRQIKGEASKIEKFRPGTLINEIDHDFIRAYEKYMLTESKNQINTIGKSFRKLKAVLNYAVVKGYIDKNPFAGFTIRSERTTREFLENEELMKLENVYQQDSLNPKLKTVLQYFIFSCYTGLRYSDVHELDWKEIFVMKKNEPAWIHIKQEKTSVLLKVPLNKKALTYLPDGKTGKVFKVISNQKTNEYLKVIMLMAGIEKTVSFHTARHTFATMALNLGISMEVVQKLLGHREMKTTQIYAKLVDTTLQREMAKFND